MAGASLPPVARIAARRRARRRCGPGKSALADGAFPRSIGGVGGRLPAAVLGAVGRRVASAPGPTGARPPSPAAGLLAGTPANECGMQRHCTPRGARWGALFWRFARRGWHGRPASAGPLRPFWALGGVRRAGWRVPRRAPLPLVSGRRRPGRRPVSRRAASWFAACSGSWRGALGLGRLPFVPPPLLGCAGLVGGPACLAAGVGAPVCAAAVPPAGRPAALPRPAAVAALASSAPGAVHDAAHVATPIWESRRASCVRLSLAWSAAMPNPTCTPTRTSVRVISRVSAPRM